MAFMFPPHCKKGLLGWVSDCICSSVIGKLHLVSNSGHWDKFFGACPQVYYHRTHHHSGKIPLATYAATILTKCSLTYFGIWDWFCNI